MSIFNTIELIRKYPGMFLWSKSITALSHYLEGYQYAEREYGICRKGELFPLPFRYLHAYAGYRLQESCVAGWRHLILNSCDGAEDIALQKFFEFYDDFKQVKMKKYWKAILSEQNNAWNNQMKRGYRCAYPGGPKPGKEPNPLAVYVIELSIPVCILVVETDFDIRPDYFSFFASPEKAKGHDLFPAGAEIYFGTIDFWEEHIAENISFDKNIII